MIIIKILVFIAFGGVCFGIGMLLGYLKRQKEVVKENNEKKRNNLPCENRETAINSNGIFYCSINGERCTDAQHKYKDECKYIMEYEEKEKK